MALRRQDILPRAHSSRRIQNFKSELQVLLTSLHLAHMPHTKPSSSTSAPVGSATVKAPPLISKRKAANLAASQLPTLPGTPLLCASVNAIVRSATQAQRAAIARSSTTRRKDHRRSAKSPPPPPLQFFLSFPSSSTATAPSPADALGPDRGRTPAPRWTGPSTRLPQDHQDRTTTFATASTSAVQLSLEPLLPRTGSRPASRRNLLP